MGLTTFSDSDYKKSKHLLAHENHFLGASLFKIKPGYIFDHFPHPVPQEIVNVEKLYFVFSRRQRKSQIF
jgi:hypothetical protein